MSSYIIRIFLCVVVDCYAFSLDNSQCPRATQRDSSGTTPITRKATAGRKRTATTATENAINETKEKKVQSASPTAYKESAPKTAANNDFPPNAESGPTRNGSTADRTIKLGSSFGRSFTIVLLHPILDESYRTFLVRGDAKARRPL